VLVRRGARNVPDLYLTVSVRCLAMVKYRERNGLTGAAAAALAGVDASAWSGLESLVDSPLQPSAMRDGLPLADSWRKKALAVADLIGLPPEMIWTEAVRAVKQRQVTMEVAAADLEAVAMMAAQRTPDEMADVREKTRLLGESLGCLSEREQRVVVGRYVEELAYEELGQELGLTRERVRQIEMRALAQLRKPSTPIGKAMAEEHR